MEKKNRREFLKNVAIKTAGLAIACGILFASVVFNRRKNKSKRSAAANEDYSKLAYCCLNCSTCDLFIATRDNNEQLKAEVAKKWEMDKSENFKLENFKCYGCKADKPGYFGAHCAVKKCAIQKGFQICAQCDDLDSCDKKLWKDFPWIKEKAKDIRAKFLS